MRHENKIHPITKICDFFAIFTCSINLFVQITSDALTDQPKPLLVCTSNTEALANQPKPHNVSH